MTNYRQLILAEPLRERLDRAAARFPPQKAAGVSFAITVLDQEVSYYSPAPLPARWWQGRVSAGLLAAQMVVVNAGWIAGTVLYHWLSP